jgi:hypothetical protein
MHLHIARGCISTWPGVKQTGTCTPCVQQLGASSDQVVMAYAVGVTAAGLQKHRMCAQKRARSTAARGLGPRMKLAVNCTRNLSITAFGVIGAKLGCSIGAVCTQPTVYLGHAWLLVHTTHRCNAIVVFTALHHLCAGVFGEVQQNSACFVSSPSCCCINFALLCFHRSNKH